MRWKKESQLEMFVNDEFNKLPDSCCVYVYIQQHAKYNKKQKSINRVLLARDDVLRLLFLLFDIF